MENPDHDALLNEEHNPADGKKTAVATTGGTGAASGSPNMEPDTTNDGYGNGDTLGNNDGTGPDPERTDPVGAASAR